MTDAYSMAASRPWAITPDGLEMVLAVLDRAGDPEALAAKRGRPLENTHHVEDRDGVSVIPVTGPIARYSNLFSDISGATSTQVLATDFRAALDNSAVRAIVLNVDSPGGEVTGINELAQMVYAARGTKPILAYIGGIGASAAYWIASAADKVVADATSVVGSIGVVMSHTDSTARDAKAGVKRHEIVSSQSPDKRADPTTEAGRAKAQQIVDDLADVFVGAVARNRGTTPAVVADRYGRGGVLVGTAAVRAGLVDSLGSLESTISEARVKARQKPPGATQMGATSPNESSPGSVSKLWANATDEERLAAHRMVLDARAKREAPSTSEAMAGRFDALGNRIVAPVPASSPWSAIVEREKGRCAALTEIKTDARGVTVQSENNPKASWTSVVKRYGAAATSARKQA